MPRPRSRALIFILILAIATPLSEGSVLASNFTITTPMTTAQSLGAGQTGTITSTGSLTIAAGSNAVAITGAGATLTNSGTITQSGTTSGSGSIAVPISGNNVTVTNLGTITQIGSDRVIRDNTGVTGLNITNGSLTNATALMQAADNDVIQMNKAGAKVILNNYGTLTSLNASGGGAQAVDFSAITAAGTNAINNFAGGLMQATEADAVRPGVNGVVYNAGTMKSTTTTGSSSDGVDAQNNTGIQITNDTTGVIDGARHGITGGALNNTSTFAMTVTNNAGGVIKGENGSGINIDGFNALETVSVTNHGTITGNGITGDGDGIDSDGLLNLTNTGVIRSINAFSAAPGTPAESEGLTVGGGTIINSGTIEGLVAAGNTNAVGRGISLLGNDITTGPLAGTREAIYGNATVTNLTGGLIRGQSDSGIVVEGPASGFTVVVNDNVGATILGGGLTTAAIQTGADNDTINEAGIINGASSNKAINMGAGNNALNVTGGAASILGDIDGGVGGVNAMTMDLGAGNAFSYSGSISDFNGVETKSGLVTLTGKNTYTGTTTVSGGTLVAAAAGGALAGTSSVSITGGTLKLGAPDQINDLASLSLDGGILDLNNFSEGLPDMNGLGSFNLFATSAIDFGDLGAGSNLIRFASFGSHTAGSLLELDDYDPGLDHLLFGALDVTAFTRLFGIDDVCFDGGCGYDVVSHGSDFELVPAAVPEPMTLSLLGLGLAGIGLRRRKRVR